MRLLTGGIGFGQKPEPGITATARTQPVGLLACAGDFDPSGFLRCGTDVQFGMNWNTLNFESHLFGADSATLQELTAATVVGTCTAL